MDVTATDYGSRSRIIDLDVARAIGLIGVCVMNYHGHLAVMDTNSQHGTLVNGVAIGRRNGRNHAVLSTGDNRIVIGSGHPCFVFTLNLS